MQNIQIALSACDATFENIIKLSIYIVLGQNVNDAFIASRKYLDKLENSPIITVLIVVGLVNPNFLLEIGVTELVPDWPSMIYSTFLLKKENVLTKDICSKNYI